PGRVVTSQGPAAMGELPMPRQDEARPTARLRTAKDELHRYLQAAREVLIWKLEGLSEYDIRRPVVYSGTNLLGVLKHVALLEAGYLGATFDRPVPHEGWIVLDHELPMSECGRPPTSPARSASGSASGRGMRTTGRGSTLPHAKPRRGHAGADCAPWPTITGHAGPAIACRKRLFNSYSRRQRPDDGAGAPIEIRQGEANVA